MVGMVAATGIRILLAVDFKTRRHSLYIVAVSIGFGMLPLVAPCWMQHMPHALHAAGSGILLALAQRGGAEPVLQWQGG